MEPIRVIPQERTPWLIYTMVALLVVATLGIFFGFMRQWQRVVPGMPAPAPNSWIAANQDSRMQQRAAFKPIMDVQIISDAVDKGSVVGDPVRLTQVCVRGTPDPSGFFVSQLRTPVIFVAFKQGSQHQQVRFRQSVDLSGTVRRLPDQKTIHERWPKLSGLDLKRVERLGVFVEIEALSINGWY